MPKVAMTFYNSLISAQMYKDKTLETMNSLKVSKVFSL